MYGVEKTNYSDENEEKYSGTVQQCKTVFLKSLCHTILPLGNDDSYHTVKY